MSVNLVTPDSRVHDYFVSEGPSDYSPWCPDNSFFARRPVVARGSCRLRLVYPERLPRSYCGWLLTEIYADFYCNLKNTAESHDTDLDEGPGDQGELDTEPTARDRERFRHEIMQRCQRIEKDIRRVYLLLEKRGI
jgi:hypothetical protein